MEIADFKKLDYEERSVIVQSYGCPIEIISWAALKDRNSSVRCWAVENLNCPPSVISEVVKTEAYSFIRFWALHNPSCPVDAIILALTDKAENVREAAANKV